MSVATDITLIRMIERKALFLELIDHLDQQDEGSAIPLSLYYETVRRNVASASETEQRQLREALDPDNLMQAGLLLELDKGRGVILFQEFVVEMFRHFDRRRIRGLSSEDLEDLRRQINSSLERLGQISLLPGEDTYEEVLALLFSRLQRIQSRIRQNVDNLRGQADRLAAIVDKHDIQDLEQAARAREALQEISRIYQRNVLPTLQFLNEREDIKNGKPALTAASDIARLFTLSGLPEVGQRVLFATTSVRSYARDIEAVRKLLERYVRQSRRHRHQYDCIEKLFGELKSAVAETHDGKLNNKYVDREHDAFRQAECFKGMKSFRFDARLDWNDRNQAFLFDEHLRVNLPKVRERQQAGATKLTQQNDERQYRERMKVMRKRVIQQLVERIAVPTEHDDLHRYLHQVMCEQLKDYRLSDLLDALGWLKVKAQRPVQVRFERASLEHAGFRLDYYPLQIVKEETVGA